MPVTVIASEAKQSRFSNVLDSSALPQNDKAYFVMLSEAKQLKA